MRTSLSETPLPRRTEAELVKAILQTLNLMPNTFAWRQETRGIPHAVRRDGRVVAWNVHSNAEERGKADIAFISKGFGGVLEVKLPGGQLKPHQKQWMIEVVDRGGGYAAVVHSVEEAEEALRELWKEKGKGR